MRTLLSWIVTLVILAGGVYFGSPYYTVWTLEQAAKAGDANAVAAKVDFPQVRANLTPALTARLQGALDREKVKPHSFFDRLAMFVAPVFVPKAVDTLVTPEGVAAMIKTGHAPTWLNPVHHEKQAAKATPGEPHAIKLGYVADDLDQFQAVIENKLSPGSRVTLTLFRRGFFTWKVTAIDLAG